MNKRYVQLSPVDREYLEALISTGELKAKTYRRALSLLELDRGQTYTAVSKTVKTTIATLSILAENYRENGLQDLHDRPRSGRPITIDGEQRAKITAFACSTPPEGHAEWSLRLSADKVVELDFAEQGVLDNTYLILTSDHGQLFERGIHGHLSPALYESVIHTPLIIHAPGQSEGFNIYSPTSALDLLPTILHLTRNKQLEGLEGRMLPLLGGAEKHERILFSIYTRENAKFMPLVNLQFNGLTS